MPCSIYKDKPEISINFGPAFDISMDSPSLFFSSFPVANITPGQAIKILQDSSCINDIVILSIIDQNFDMVKHNVDIGYITLSNISLETVINFITTREIINMRWYPKFCFMTL